MRNDSGLSLVELMIAAAGLAALAVVVMQLTKTQTEVSVKGKLDSDILLTTNEIISILSDPDKCFNTLGGKNALSTTSGINAINLNKFFSVESGSSPDSGYGNSNLKIQNYSLSSNAGELANKNGLLIIKYQNKKLLKGDTGPEFINRKINLYVEVDGANNILKCRSRASAATDIWSRGTGAIIYYDEGNVGVGNSTPTDLFSVGLDSALRINSDGDIVVTGGVDSEWGIYKRNAMNINHEVIHISNNNNLGIGISTPVEKLEVNGALKLIGVSVGAGCTNTGAQAFDSATGAPVYCNNGSPKRWTLVGGGLSSCVTRAASNAVSCNADEVMTGASCNGDDHCGGNDSSAYGGVLTTNGINCKILHCTSSTAYVRCCK